MFAPETPEQKLARKQEEAARKIRATIYLVVISGVALIFYYIGRNFK